MPPNKIGVFVADDHEMVRKGLYESINATADMTVVGTVSDGVELLKNLEQQHDIVHVALVDIGMGRMDGLTATAKIKESYKNIKVIVITGLNDKNYGAASLQNHADGYIAKSRTLKEIIDAIRQVADGKNVFLPDPNEPDLPPPPPKTLPDRSPTEQRILCLIVKGKSSKEIAFEMKMSQPNVEKYRRNLIYKFGAQNTATLVSIAVQNGLCTGA